MELVDITFRNFKIHRNYTVKFQPGVNGIVGENGSGKSSIVQAIIFLFTGDIETDSKQQLITAGETEGWVSGRFILNGKPGKITRHLSTSKVFLEYDGKSYNKSSEIKTLWSQLMQIDASVFKNVIVAGQGVIPLLFCGDSSVREKVFQKIFLVPPTEKIRSTIWNNYIKTCPPEYLVEDQAEIRSKQAELATQRNQVMKQLDDLQASMLTPIVETNVRQRVFYIKTCIADQSKRPAIEQDLEKVKNSLSAVRNDIATLTEELADIPIDAYKAELQRQLGEKQKALDKQKLQAQLDKMIAEANIDIADRDDLAAELVEAERKAQELTLEHLKLSSEVNALTNQINKYSKFDKSAGMHCPECGQAVKDGPERLAHLNEEKTKLLGLYQHAFVESSKWQKREKELRARVTEIDRITSGIALCNQQIALLEVGSFSDEEMDVLREVQTQHKTKSYALNQKIKEETALTNASNNLNFSLAALKQYDGELTAEEELELMQAVLQKNIERRNEVSTLQTTQAVIARELELLDKRLQTSEENRKRNEKRKDYMDTLHGIHDLLHTSKFPRDLIQTYSEYVEHYLALNLEMFDIPYTVRIGEGFRLVINDQEGNIIPEVSGGQQVIIGLCLRLALHRMFAQSFPIWIVDEGTSHLDKVNRELYFQLVANLKAQKLIDQIILIDHDEQLSGVVDHVIALERPK